MSYTQADLDKQYQAPTLRLVQTVGGYYRVEISGPDQLQDQVARPRCFLSDVARALTKDDALRMAREWFDRMRDDSPSNPPSSDSSK